MDSIKRKNPFPETQDHESSNSPVAGPSTLSLSKRPASVHSGQLTNINDSTATNLLAPPQTPGRARSRSVSPLRRSLRIGTSTASGRKFKSPTNSTATNINASPSSATLPQLAIQPSRPSSSTPNSSSGIPASAPQLGNLYNQPIGTNITGNQGTSNQPPIGTLVSSIHDTIVSLRTAVSDKEKRRWRYTNRHGEEVVVVNSLGRILKSMERYAQIIDVAIQHHPEITALVWSGVRFILLAAIERIQLMESLEFTLATVVGKMASCEFYAAIYANRLSISLESATTTQAMTERLGGALNDMYEAIRDFTLQAKEYFGDSKLPISIKIKNLFTPFAVKMKPAIEAIADKEKIIRELADMATMERMMESSHHITVIQGIVQEIRNEIHSVANFPATDLLRTATENLTLTEETLLSAHAIQSKLENLQVQVVKALQPQQQALLSPMSLDPELQQLKHRFFTESTEADIYNPDLYVPARGMLQQNTPDTEHFDLEERVVEFLSQRASEKVCLIQGTGGSGKSTFNHHLARHMWDAYDKCLPDQQATMAIPIFVTLANMHDSTCHNKDLIAQLFQDLGWDEQRIKQAREELRFVFILDGYDEIEKRDRNIYVDSKLFTWNAKTIITSRPEYLGHGYQNNFQPPGQPRLLKEYWVAPFSTESIRSYIQKYVRATSCGSLPTARSHTVHEYEEFLFNPQLRVLISNPFLLRMAMSIQPTAMGSQTAFSRVSLYKQFIQHWIQGAQVRLSRVQLPKPLSEVFVVLSEENFVQHVHSYCQRFAVALYQHQLLEATYNPTHSSHVSNRPGYHDDRLGHNPIWETFLTNSDPKPRLLRFSSPLLRVKNSFRFLHKSLRDYLVAESLWEDNSLGTAEAFLNQFCIVDDPGVLDFIKEQAQHSQKLTEQLFACVELSKTCAAVAQAAANAITILVKAEKQFTRHDLRSIRIPGADLSNGWFDRVELRAADLRNVRLQACWLRGADIRGSRMDGVFFREKAAWKRELQDNSVALRGARSLSFIPGEGPVFLCQSKDSGSQTSFMGLWSITRDELIHRITSSLPDFKWQAIWTELFNSKSSPDGTLFALAGSFFVFDGAEKQVRGIMIWSIALKFWVCFIKNSCPCSCSCYYSSHDLAFSCHNSILASSCSEGGIRLWSATEGTLLHEFDVSQSGIVTCITFGFEDKFLFSGARDSQVRVWSPSDRTLNCVFEQREIQTKSVFEESNVVPSSIACLSHKLAVAVGCIDGNIQIWSIPPHQRLVRLIKTEALNKYAVVGFSPDGSVLVAGFANGRINMWSTEDWTLIHTIKALGSPSPCTHIVPSPDEQLVAVAFHDTTVRMIMTSHLDQPTSGVSNESPAWTLDSARVTSLSWSPDSQQLAVGTVNDAIVRLLSIVDGHTLRCFEGHTSWITSVAFSPDGQLLASATYAKDLQMWSVPDQNVYHLEMGTDTAGSIAFSPNGGLIALGSYDRRVYLRSFPNNETFCYFEGHKGWITCVAFSPNGELLASGSSDETIRLWSVDESKSVCCYEGHIGWVTSIAFSPDGEFLASCGNDFTVRIWPVSENGREIHCLRGHEDRVSSVMFSPCGELLASGSIDKTIRLWSVHLKSFIAQIHIGFPVEVIEWTKAAGYGRGGYLAVGTDPAIVQVWRIVVQPLDNSDNPSLDISCEWATNQGTLNLREANIEGVRGLEPMNVRLFKQHGAIGNPIDSRVMEIDQEEQ